MVALMGEWVKHEAFPANGGFCLITAKVFSLEWFAMYGISVSIQIESILCIQLLFSGWCTILNEVLLLEDYIHKPKPTNTNYTVLQCIGVSWYLGSNISIHVNHVSSHLYQKPFQVTHSVFQEIPIWDYWNHCGCFMLGCSHTRFIVDSDFSCS